MAMGRGGQVSGSLKTWTKVKLRKNGSDGSDECEDEFIYLEDKYCSSLANDETEESFEEIEEEDNVLVKNNIKNAGKLNNGIGIPRKRKPSCVDSDYFSGGERRKRPKLSRKEKEKEDNDSIFSLGEEGKEDSDTGESDDDDSDEEFTPDEFDSADDDDDELTLTNKVQETVVTNGKKRKRNPKASKRRNVRKKPTKGCSLQINDVEETPSQRKQQERKGKEKVVEVGKQLQVCGVCLSEEGKRIVRGVLNCCTHYFCFDCIMEWSKVESRCPLCKRRFATIRRAARVDGRCDPNDVVIPIPERDQVYQTSEEELRGHIYPYDNVYQPSEEELRGHLYPDDNVYQLSEEELRDLYSTYHESFCDPNYVLESPTPQVTIHSCSSPRYPSRGDVFSNSTSLGAYTLLERRQTQSRIEEFLEDVRRQRSEVNDGVGSTMSPISLFSSQQDVPHVPVASYPNLRSLGRVSELSEIGHHQQVAHPRNSSIPNTEPDFKEQVQSMVKSHLKSLSRNMDMDLGYNKFKQIARTSTHTVLAAVGLEHRLNQVYPVHTSTLCKHTFASGSTNQYLVKGQCSACFNLIVKSVVKEIMLVRGPSQVKARGPSRGSFFA